MAQPTILLADDDPILRDLGSESLIAADFRVATAENGENALEVLDRERFDLVVLDIDMPNLDGLSALKRIRASEDDRIASLPVIMLTGRDDDASIREAYASGATSYISKPVNWMNMAHQIAFVLKASRDADDLRAAHEAAVAQSRTKDAVMMTLRHELRSPLHVVSGFTSLLLDSLGDRLKDDEKQSLSMIHEAVGDLSDKMNQLFVYADVLTGSFRLNPDFTSARRVINKAVDTVRPLAEASSVKIKIEVPDGSPIELMADEEKLAICLAQLLDNAIKYSPDGTTVTASVSQDSQTSLVSISVEDEGAGIDEAQSHKLYEPFAQGDSGLDRSSVGLGLGLTVAKSIAECHDGTVTLANRDGSGTRATLRLPTGLAAAQDEAA